MHVARSEPIWQAPLPAGPDRLAWVLDPGLALARGGLLAVTRLASVAHFDVWLPRELREVLREPRAFLDRTDLLRPLVTLGRTAAGGESGERRDGRTGADELRRELEGWERWRTIGRAWPSRLLFIGDRPDESVLPTGSDDRLGHRFERLQRGLDALMHPTGPPTSSAIVADCVRDALALSVALLPRRSFVLARMGAHGDLRPLFCEQVRVWGLRAPHAPRHGGRTAQSLRDALARAMWGPLSWAGVRVAALHVVMPGFVAAADGVDSVDQAEVSRAWLDTDVFWHEVTA